MARTVGSHGPTTLAAIRKAGLDLIYTHGFEAMTMRMLAEAVGIKQGSLYNHCSTKQDFLFDLLKEHMEALIAAANAELVVQGDARERFDGFVRFHVDYHLERRREVSLANFELRSLGQEHLATIVRLRHDYEDRLARILADGVEQACFRVPDVKVATFAIISMLTGVSTWYDRKGPRNREEIIRYHLQMARGMVGLTGEADAPAASVDRHTAASALTT